MREIKFKSYVKKEGKIESIIWCPFNEDRSSPDFDAPVKGDLLAYGLQFTGLKDKNGKEIYEGDIVKELIFEEQIGRHSVSANCELIGSVEFNERQAKFIVKMVKNNLNIISSEFGWGYERFEVIGNIYENPGTSNP